MNILDLRNDLIKSYEKLRDGEMNMREAQVRANLAGKILASAKIQMDYNINAKKTSKIKFLNVDENL